MEVFLAILVVILTLLIAWLGGIYFRKRKKSDDVYEYYSRKARSISWFVSLATIVIIFILLGYSNINLDMYAVMGTLMFVHIGSWGISVIIFMMNALSE